MAGYTKGSWYAREIVGKVEFEVVKHKDGPSSHPWYIALCYDHADGCSAEANARLIAAAPELLEALERMLDLAELTVGFSQPAMKQSAKALSRAKGEVS